MTPQVLASEPPARTAPVVGGMAALALGCWGEWRTEAGDPTWLGVLLFLASIALFALSARPLGPAPADWTETTHEPLPGRRRGGWRDWLVLFVGVGTALGLLLMALQLLQAHWDSVTGTSLWGASIAVIALTGVLLGRWQQWPARWGARALPETIAARTLLAAAVISILCLATIGRLLWLDQIPRGINPDEGDRAVTSIEILRGLKRPLFDFGWYHISMVYFWILAQVMNVVGISFVGARVLGAVSGIVTVAAVIWMGIRHFGYRAGVLAGGLAAVLGIALQFARETTEATPTAMLWTLSTAAFLEAARTGRSLSWVIAGLTGGFSMYFYPTGRMWAAVAVPFCAYLLVHGLGGRRWHILRGAALAAIASLLITAPFLLHAAASEWDSFTIRARQTSIFVKENPTRLPYYRPEWGTARLLQEQVVRSIGILNRYSDQNGFWPTHRPLMSGLLATLTVIGLGWIYLRPLDPRFVLLAIWFAVGISGAIVTVETPNVQRMATAIPVLAFLPALVLDSLTRRVEAAAPFAGSAARRLVATATTAIVAAVMATLMLKEWRFYFTTYGAMDEWPEPTLLGTTVRDQGEDTDVFSMGRQAHIVNQGWVRLLAPETPRGGLRFPAAQLPLALESDHNLAILVTPQQPHYLPYLRDLYPGAVETPVFSRGQVLCTMFRVDKAQRRAMLGALATAPEGAPVRVSRLGEAPPDWSTYPSPMRWTAIWRIPRYWNYALRIGPAPARLTIDGTTVLTVSAGDDVQTTEVALAQGDHFVEYDGTLSAPGQSAVLEWAPLSARVGGHAQAPLEWSSVPVARLRPALHPPGGLLGVVTLEGRAGQQRIDGTLATGSLVAEAGYDGRLAARWTGTLHAPVDGTYGMDLFTQGKIDLRVDGKPMLHSAGPVEEPIEAKIDLQAGPHPVEVVYEVDGGPAALEWTWTPPGGERSIVPRSALTPPAAAGVGPPLPAGVLAADQMPIEQPIEIGK